MYDQITGSGVDVDRFVVIEKDPYKNYFGKKDEDVNL